jgi:hypothetical protein
MKAPWFTVPLPPELRTTAKRTLELCLQPDPLAVNSGAEVANVAQGGPVFSRRTQISSSQPPIGTLAPARHRLPGEYFPL